MLVMRLTLVTPMPTVMSLNLVDPKPKVMSWAFEIEMLMQKGLALAKATATEIRAGQLGKGRWGKANYSWLGENAPDKTSEPTFFRFLRRRTGYTSTGLAPPVLLRSCRA